MVFSPKAPVRIQPYFGHRSRGRLLLSARALKSGSPNFRKTGGRLQAIRTMLAQFASREAEGVEVRLEIELADGRSESFTRVTDAEGFVHFDVTLDPELAMPDATMWDVVALHWTNEDGPQCVEGHVLAPAANARLAVISDIDDTIIETGITGGFRSIARNWRRVVAQLPEDRIAVPGADAFYGALGGGAVLQDGASSANKHIPATNRPFFYISSSPWNLYSYLIAFQRANKLPLGPLKLRDWGFDRATLGKKGHGAHKSAAIREILAMYPDLRFALIGDDTQGDLPAYGEAVRAYPGRIAAIFMRKAAGEVLNAEEQTAKALIEAAGVPMFMGETWEEGQKFLKAAGVSMGGETEQIVRRVEGLVE
ncbi:phosphatase domain-containing protein [Paraurantiacibacter namhicola]|uniref:Phosphatidate phosphatase APP1 catalytic domain-containing protein n=1 Tax=Paraurantiacibacter namhicola TaxID=645517 RepID=A0A1C7D687_9SPHN|nr:phosphatase domain-containing protein [Paraurantiacibacter namhicola]ANU06823.1 hypothetical protein A6F65_00498 [Paraurantiacibacter namhicola]